MTQTILQFTIDNIFFGECWTGLHPDPLDLVEANLVLSTIVELGGAGTGMIGHGSRILQRTAVLEIGSDPSGSEAVVADPGTDASCQGTSLHHEICVGLRQGGPA